MRLSVILCFVAAISADKINNDFLRTNKHISINLYKSLLDIHNGSFIACPESLQMIFSLINLGARGKTAEELTTALLLPNNVRDIKAGVEEAMTKIKKQNKQHIFKVVNKIYVQKTFEIAAELKDIAVDVFKSDIENIDFKDREQAAQQINQWVSNQTNNNIPSLITKHDIAERTPAVLINTIYLEATWNDKFTSVHPEDFHISRDKQTTVNMMEQDKLLLYYESADLKAKFLKLRYLKSDIAMIVVLPNEIDGLSKLEDSIEKVLNLPNFQTKKVHVKLPKFEITKSVELIPILQKWGVAELFKPQADLTGIGASQGAFYISEVLQKNYINVHENGTAVASATIATPRLGARRGEPEHKEFVADHPFIYYVISPHGIVFLGRFTGN